MTRRKCGKVSAEVVWREGRPGRPAHWLVRLSTPEGRWRTKIMPEPGHASVQKDAGPVVDAVVALALDEALTAGFPVLDYGERDGWCRWGVTT